MFVRFNLTYHMFKSLFTSSIDDKIVRLLSTKTYRTTILLKTLLTEISISRQSFYEALRRLVKNEVIVVNKKLVSLNKLWIEQLIHFTQETTNTYKESYRIESRYLELQPGEHISYIFKSLETMDRFLNHATLLIAEQSDKKIPSVVFNPHNWFFVARQTSELTWWRTLQRLGIMLFIANGGKTDADKQIGRYINNLKNNHIRFSLTDTEIFKKNHFINIYGDIILEVKLEEGIGQEIDHLFSQSKDIMHDQEKFQHIIKKVSRARLIITNNPKRAEILRKKIMKYFYVEVRK